MSENQGMEILTPAAEKFSVPSSSDEDEDVVWRNKRTKNKTKLKSSPGIQIEDEDMEQSKEEKEDEDPSGPAEKSPLRVKKKSRLLELDESSSDEEEVEKNTEKELKSSPGIQIEDEDMGQSKEKKEDEDPSGSGEKSPLRVKKKSRLLELDDSSSSDEEEVEKNTGKDGNDDDVSKLSLGKADFSKDEEKSNDCDSDNEEGKDKKLSENSSDDDDDESTKSDDESAKSDDDSADSSDDDSPPLRLFRNKNPTAVNESRGMGMGCVDDDLYDDERGGEEEIARPDPSEIAEPRPSRGKPRRPTMQDLYSETQRLVRESSVNLPYHRPEPKRLSDFMKRPTLGKDRGKETREHSKKVKVQAEIVDELPDFGDCKSAKTPEENMLLSADGQINRVDNSEDTKNDDSAKNKEGDDDMETGCHDNIKNDVTTQNTTNTEKMPDTTPDRPLTRRERLLRQLGQNLPQLSTPKESTSPSKFIDLDDEPKQSKQSSGVTSLLERFMKHSSAVKHKTVKTPKKTDFSIIRKQERSDGSGVELVPDVVTATTGETTDDKEDDIRDVKNVDTAGTPGQRLQLLRQRLAQKMKKRREIERKKREEVQKLDNEELASESEEEEECELSDAESDEEELDEEEEPIKKEERSGNGVIDDSDESDEEEDTEPFEGNTKSNSSFHPPDHDASLPRVVNEGSVLLFDESTRSSGSTLNKSSILDGRLTPAFDRTCSDDSFYSSMIPLHQPEVSNVSNSSHYLKPQLSKRGEFDDTCFESDSRSISQPFQLDFEASQSQLLDADGFIRQSSGSKLIQKRIAPLLPPGAEDDNAMSECNMSQLLDLCSAPFDSSLTPLNSKPDDDITEDVDDITEDVDDVTEDVDDFTKDKTAVCGDVTKDDDNSGDLFRNDDLSNIDESFGFNILPAEPQKPLESALKFSDEEDSDEEEPMTIVRKKKLSRQRIAREFLENEAELSGSDDSEDEEDVGPDEYEVEEQIEELPKEEELHRQVNRMHMRQVMEDDQRDIELLQEAFMGGEEIADRERKFRWKNMDASLTQDMFKSDDEDDNNDDAALHNEDTKWMKERLEREEFLRKSEEQVVERISEDSQLLKFGRQVMMSRQNSCTASITSDLESANSLQGGMSRTGRLSADETSSSRDSYKNKGRKGSFLSRSTNVLSKLASLQELKKVNGPRNTDKMLFKAVSPKSDKRKRKQLSEVNSNTATKGPPRKRTKVVSINEDSNSVFDLF